MGQFPRGQESGRVRVLTDQPDEPEPITRDADVDNERATFGEPSGPRQQLVHTGVTDLVLVRSPVVVVEGQRKTGLSISQV